MDGRVYAALTKAMEQIDSSIKEQEKAANRILGMAELVYKKTPSQSVRLQIDAIMEACSFHDLSSQQLKKALRIISYLRDQGMMKDGDLPESIAPPSSEESQGLSQDQINKLLQGGDALTKTD
jgi:hypothetical protein